MSKFESLVKRRSYDNFNQKLAKNVQGYGDMEEIGLDDVYKIYKITINPNGDTTVGFIAGIHGDEPGGPLGALKFLEDKVRIPSDKKVIIIPLANPTGYELGTRENCEGVDINREFMKKRLKDECKCVWDGIKDEKLEVLHTLHEDPDLKSFYCYYSHHKKIAEEIRTLAEKYFEIFNREQRKPIEGELYGDKIIDGLCPLPHIVRGTLEDKILLESNIPYITTESPGKMPLSRRVNFNCQVMKLVINGI